MPYPRPFPCPHLEQPSHEVGSLTFPYRRPWGVRHRGASAQPGLRPRPADPGAPPRSLAGGCPSAFAQLGHFPKCPAGWRGGCAPRPGALETFIGHYSMATKHRSEMLFGVLGDWSPSPCYPPEFSKSYKELRYLYHRVTHGYLLWWSSTACHALNEISVSLRIGSPRQRPVLRRHGSQGGVSAFAAPMQTLRSARTNVRMPCWGHCEFGPGIS